MTFSAAHHAVVRLDHRHVAGSDNARLDPSSGA